MVLVVRKIVILKEKQQHKKRQKNLLKIGVIKMYSVSRYVPKPMLAINIEDFKKSPNYHLALL